MGNQTVPGSSTDVNVQIRALSLDPNVSSQYKTKILQKNVVDGVNTLTQSMMPLDTGQNTKYVIKYDYTLGENITVPNNCVLEFDGGSIQGNNTLNVNNALLQGNVLITCQITGYIKNEVLYASWFNILGDGTDETSKLLYFINLCKDTYKIFDFEKKNVYITSTINFPERFAGTIIKNLNLRPNINTFTSSVEDKPVLYIKKAHHGVDFKNFTIDLIGENSLEDNGITGIKIGEGYDSVRRFSFTDSSVSHCGTGLKVLSSYYSRFIRFGLGACYYGIKWVPYETNSWAGASWFRDCTIGRCYVGCQLHGYISSLNFDNCYFEADAYKLVSDGGGSRGGCDAYFNYCYFADGGLVPIIVNGGKITIFKSSNLIEGTNNLFTDISQEPDPNKCIVVNGGHLLIQDVELGDVRYDSTTGKYSKFGYPVIVNGGICEFRNVRNSPANPIDYLVNNGSLILPKARNYIKCGTNLGDHLDDFKCDIVVDGWFKIKGHATKSNDLNRYGNYGIFPTAVQGGDTTGLLFPYKVDSLGPKAVILGIKTTIDDANEIQSTLVKQDSYYDIMISYGDYSCTHGATINWMGIVARLFPYNIGVNVYPNKLNVITYLLDIKEKEGTILFTEDTRNIIDFVALVDIEYANSIIDFIDDDDNVGSTRPTTGLNIGDQYFDITLGKPIYWNGTAWVDSLGNPVNTNYQAGIDASHKLNADLVDDTSSTNKFGSSITGTAGNLAGFDANGKLADSGKKPSDFEPAST